MAWAVAGNVWTSVWMDALAWGARAGISLSKTPHSALEGSVCSPQVLATSIGQGTPALRPNDTTKSSTGASASLFV